MRDSPVERNPVVPSASMDSIPAASSWAREKLCAFFLS